MLFGGLLSGCVAENSSAPIETIHNFGDVSSTQNSDPSAGALGTTDATASAEVDDEDHAMQQAVASSNAAPQLKVQRHWDYQTPEVEEQAAPPKIQYHVAPVAKTPVHNLVNGELISDDAGVLSIQSKAGEKVHSVEKGTLIYTGPSVQGGGKMVIVKNADGTLFAYSHLASVTLAEGHAVNALDVIGTASDEPLVFQVRQAGGVIDAKKYV